MTDVNVKLISSADPRHYEQETSSYLLDTKVVEDLKEAVKNAKDSTPVAAQTAAARDH